MPLLKAAVDAQVPKERKMERRCLSIYFGKDEKLLRRECEKGGPTIGMVRCGCEVLHDGFVLA